MQIRHSSSASAALSFDLVAAAGLVPGSELSGHVLVPAQAEEVAASMPVDAVAVAVEDLVVQAPLAEVAFAEDPTPAVMAAYEAVAAVDEAPVLLAQASRGGPVTDAGAGAGVAVKDEDDDKGGNYWWGLLGLLALGGGGGGGSGGTVVPSDNREAWDLGGLSYSTNDLTTDIYGITSGSTGKLGYPGSETEFGFQVSNSSNTNALSFSVVANAANSYTVTLQVNGLVPLISTETYPGGDVTFAAWMKGILDDLDKSTGTISLTGLDDNGNDLMFTLNGYSFNLSLDNNADNGNLINSLVVTFDDGAFTLAVDGNAPQIYDFQLGSDAFPSGTYLIDDADISAFLTATDGEYAVVVNDMNDINNIDMSSGPNGIDGIQVVVVDPDGGTFLATLSSTPVSYQQLFEQNSYSVLSV